MTERLPTVDGPSTLPEHPHELVGRSLGRFRLLRPLGAGGMGEVYLARDPTLARDVAIKVLPQDRVADDRVRARLLREARSAAAVHHPAIATLFEVGEADGHVFLVMELVEGRSLAARLADGPLPVEEVLQLASALADALAHAHAAGVVHRDIKPENIMVDAAGQPKILDFGIAKRLGPSVESVETPAAATIDERFKTMEGHLVGTPAYMSPEQAMGLVVDHRSDLFSLGIVLYEMLAGVLPFNGPNPLAQLTAIVNDRPPRLSKARSDVPAGLARVIRKLLAKEPSGRPSSAAELRDTIESLRHRGVGRRGWGRWAVGVAAVLALALAGGVGLLSRGPADSDPAPAPEAESPAPPPSLTEQRLTANPAELWITSALPTSDGRGLVYQDESGIYRAARRDDEPVPVPLPDGVSGVLQHVFADGRLLLSEGGEDPGPLTLVEGDHARRIEVAAHVAVVSPDENDIAFSSPGGVFLIPVAGGAPRELARCEEGDEVEQLAYAPGGGRLAFVRIRRRADDTVGELVVVDLADGAETRALESVRLLQTGGMTGLSWRDDDRLLVPLFGDPSQRPESTLHEIQLVDGAPGGPRAIHVFEGAAGVTELHRTASGLIFMKLVAQADVMRGHAGEGGPFEDVARVTQSDRNERPGAVAADGTVYFVSDRRGTWDLYRLGPEARRAEQLTRGEAHDTYPRLTSDGAVLFFRLEVETGGAIVRARVMRLEEGAEPRAITEVRVEENLRPGGRPAPEAARLRCGSFGCALSTLVDEELVIERLDPETGVCSPLLRLPAPSAYHDWDVNPEGTTVAYVTGTPEVTLIPLDAPGERRVVPVGRSGRLIGLAYAPEGWLAVTGLHVDDDRYVLFRVREGAPPEVLHRSTHAYFAHPVVGEGGHVWFGQQNYDLDVWALDGL